VYCTVLLRLSCLPTANLGVCFPFTSLRVVFCHATSTSPCRLYDALPHSLSSQRSTASCLQTPPLPLASCSPAGCCVTPVVAPPPPLVLSARCLCLSSSRHAACLATSRLRLTTRRRLLSPGTSPLVCLSFDGWFSHIISSCRRLKCPSSTPAFIHTSWLLRLISLRCFRLPSSHQHRRLLMRWLLTSHPVCLSFAPTSCLCV
jgi:hypothetical protein